MMSKILKFFSALLASSTAFLPFVSISSCNLKKDISFVLPDIVTEDYFEVDCFFANQPSSSVQVKIVESNSPDIRIVDPIIFVKDKKSKLKFEVFSSFSIFFTFKIQFIFNDSNKKRQTILSESKSFYYSWRSTPKEDRIVPRQRRLILQNSHFAEFNFLFYITSHVSVVELKMVNSTSPSIKLEQAFCDVEYNSEKGQWIANVNVNIDPSVTEISFFNFDLSFSFTNTFEKKQTTIIKGLSLGYTYNQTDVIPDDYFNIEKIDENQYALIGLNDWVDPNLLKLFSIIKIPKKVTTIGDDAFSDPFLFDHINKIVFNKDTIDVGDNAFTGCVNLFQIDISEYEREPEWILKHDTNIFADINLSDGYIWVNDIFHTDFSFLEQIENDLYHNCSLPGKWSAFTNLDIIPDDFYEIDNDELIGFYPSSVYQLDKYKIIKIPNSVKKLSPNCLSALSILPYKNVKQSDKTYSTRRLILNSDITEINDLNFYGISGPLIFCTPNLLTIPSSCCQDLIYYNLSAIDYHDVDYEPLTIHFINTDQLRSIEENAFYDCGAVGKLALPSSLTELKSNAFARNSFSEISVLSSNITIEPMAFYNIEASHNFTIEKIDLSSFTLKSTPLPWLFEENSNIFQNSCLSKGTVYFSKKSRDQIIPKFSDFLKAQGIPQENWIIVLK